MKSKYNNKKVKLDGVIFDSKSEAAYYWTHLKPKLERGEISNLEFHPKIKCEIGGKHICYYNADFRYLDPQMTGPLNQQGCYVLVEVKGFKTETYRLKIKLVAALHPALKILVISSKDLRSEISLLPPDSLQE